MNFSGGKTNTDLSAAGSELYRALASGDLPSAWLICKDIKESSNPASEFNCGLCFFLLEEWEKALDRLKNAEKLLGNPPEFDIADKKLLLKAIELKEKNGGGERLIPLDPDSSVSRSRCGLIQVRRLAALCLIKLERDGEAAPLIRFLSQYNINI